MKWIFVQKVAYVLVIALPIIVTKCLDVSIGKLYVSCHVISNEYIFPYQTPTLVQYPSHTLFISLPH